MIIRIALALLIAAAAAAADLAQAKELLAAGRFPEATEAAEAVPARHADFAKARYLAGEVHLLLGDAAAAEASFRAASEARPGSAPILTGLGRALLAKENEEEAVKVLEQAVAADPKSGRARCFLGVARLAQSYGKKGRADLKAGAKLAPDDPEVARAIVLAWLDGQEPARAMAAANRFRKTNKKHPMGPFLTALVYEQTDEYDDAIEGYQKAIALDDSFLDAHKNLAILCIAQNPMYKNQKRTELAFEHFRRYEELGGKDEKVLQIHATLKKFFKR